MMRLKAVLSLAILMVLAACTASTPGDPSEPEASATSDGSTGSPPPSLTPLPTFTPLPPVTPKPTPTLLPGVPTLPPGGTVSDGEAPASLLAEIKADLVERTGVQESAITVVRSLAVTWNDGSLGCPKPGMNYTQALVPGYWVVLEADDVIYDYRATTRGSFSLCT